MCEAEEVVAVGASKRKAEVRVEKGKSAVFGSYLKGVDVEVGCEGF